MGYLDRMAGDPGEPANTLFLSETHRRSRRRAVFEDDGVEIGRASCRERV